MTYYKGKPRPGPSFYVATMQDVFGYGITAYGATPKEAEDWCRKEYQASNRAINKGQVRTWKEAKENWGFSIEKVHVPSAAWDGTGNYVQLD